jgi:hypothetical protein
MSKIPLKNIDGEIVAYAIIDEEDCEYVNKYKWHLSRGYAICTQVGRMHRYIMKAKKGDPSVDHLNNDRLDNRKSNLRYVTPSQNNQNMEKTRGVSKYKGVGFSKLMNKWTSNCMKERYHFDNEDHAAWWYNQLAIKHFGTDAKVNNIEKPEDFTEPVTKSRKSRELPTGINLSKNKKKFEVDIQYNKKRYYLGSYNTVEEAKNAYDVKKKEFEDAEELERLSKEIVRNNDNIAVIKTSKGEDILVDDDKYHELNKFTWTLSYGYAISWINSKCCRMHSYILNTSQIIDHINNNRADNRVSNLRICTDSANNHNKAKKENCMVEYIGVSMTKHDTFYSYINKDDKRYYLGTYGTAEQAAKARDKKALELYKDSARLNFPEDLE